MNRKYFTNDSIAFGAAFNHWQRDPLLPASTNYRVPEPLFQEVGKKLCADFHVDVKNEGSAWLNHSWALRHNFYVHDDKGYTILSGTLETQFGLCGTAVLHGLGCRPDDNLVPKLERLVFEYATLTHTQLWLSDTSHNELKHYPLLKSIAVKLNQYTAYVNKRSGNPVRIYWLFDTDLQYFPKNS